MGHRAHKSHLHEPKLVRAEGRCQISAMHAKELTFITPTDMLYRRVGSAGLSSRTCLSTLVWPAWCIESGAVLWDLSRHVAGPKLHLSEGPAQPEESSEPASSCV